MPIVHAKSVTVADATGTVTGWFGSTTVTIAASAIQLPGDWNSAHNVAYTLTGNTTQGSTVSGTNIIFAGSGGVSVGGSNGSIIISGAAGGGGGVTRNYFNPQDAYVQVAGQQGNASMHMQPAYFPNVTLDRLAMPVIFTNATNSTGTLTLTMQCGIYSRTASTFSLLASTSITTAITFSGTVNNSTYAGMRLLTIPWSTSFSEDQYYVGIHSRSTSGGANGSISQFLASQLNSNFSGILGAASNTTVQYTRGLGTFSNTFSTAMPGSVAVSNIRGAGASLVLRQPIFYMVNGTF